MTDTPELDKLKKVSEESNAIGQFLDWMVEQGFTFDREWREEHERPCALSEGDGVTGLDPTHKIKCIDGILHEWWDGKIPRWTSTHKQCGDCGGKGVLRWTEYREEDMTWQIESLLARYYDIDLQRVEEERMALLQELRMKVNPQ